MQLGICLSAGEDVEEDIDPNKLGALAMEAMLSCNLCWNQRAEPVSPR